MKNSRNIAWRDAIILMRSLKSYAAKKYSAE